MSCNKVSLNVCDVGHVTVHIAVDALGFVDVSKSFSRGTGMRAAREAVLGIVDNAHPCPRGKAKSLMVMDSKAFHPILLKDVVSNIGSGDNASFMEWVREAARDADRWIADLLHSPSGFVPSSASMSSPAAKAWQALLVHKGFVNVDDLCAGLGASRPALLIKMNYDLKDGDIHDDGAKEHIRAPLARRMWELIAEDRLAPISEPTERSDKVRS